MARLHERRGSMSETVRREKKSESERSRKDSSGKLGVPQREPPVAAAYSQIRASISAKERYDPPRGGELVATERRDPWEGRDDRWGMKVRKDEYGGRQVRARGRRVRWVTRARKSYASTVYGQLSRVRRGAGTIRRGTSVIPSVSCRDRLDSENAVFPVRTRYGDVGSMVAVDRSPVKGPGYLERLIALRHGAGHGDQFAPAGWLVAESEGQYLRGDWKQRLEESKKRGRDECRFL